uniref:PRORP domain-containing protein n=1 Tax=Plectus sambesii TaxID=2011161 RepID=A0A914URW4_9BILA
MPAGSESDLRSERQRCYDARDKHFSCLNENNQDESKCKETQRAFEQNCAASWVAYFTRKHKLEKYKLNLETKGFIASETDEYFGAKKSFDRVASKPENKFNQKKSNAEREANRTSALDLNQLPLFSAVSGEDKQRFFPLTNALAQELGLGQDDRVLSAEEVDKFRQSRRLKSNRNSLAFDAQVLSTFRGGQAYLFFRSYLSRLLEVGEVFPGTVLEAARTFSGLYMNGEAEAGDSEIVGRLLEIVETKPMPELLALPAKVFLMSCSDRWLEAVDLICSPSFSSVMSSGCANSVACAALRALRIDVFMDLVDRLDAAATPLELNSANTCQQFLQECRRLASDDQHELCETAFKWFLKRLQAGRRVIDDSLADHLLKTTGSVKCSSQKNSVLMGKRAVIGVDGRCNQCRTTLASNDVELTTEEHNALTEAVLQTIISGSNVYANTTPVELENFLKFINRLQGVQRPSVVIDGLNLYYRCKLHSANADKYNLMNKNIAEIKQTFDADGVLVIGRKHFTKPKNYYNQLCSIASVFLVDHLSQDDGFMIYAALKSGEKTLLISNDMFGDHLHTLTERNPEMGRLLVRWMECRVVRFEMSGRFAIQLPTHHRVATQCDSSGDKWHVPYRREDQESLKHISTWLCIAPERHLIL